MKMRYYNSSGYNDYNALTEFWMKHEHDIIPKEMLSPVGFVAETNSKIIGATFLYIMDGCDVVQIAWTTLNPLATTKEKYNALNGMYKMIMTTCEIYKKKNIIMFSDKHGLSKFFNKRGFDMYSEHTLLRRGL